MTVGTTLSRLTGFLRLAAMTATLGVTVSALGSVYTVANLTPNILYELILGGILTSVFVPVFVARMETHGDADARDVADRVGHRQHRQAEGKRNPEKTDAQTRESCR